MDASDNQAEPPQYRSTHDHNSNPPPVDRKFENKQKVWKKDPATGVSGQELFYVVEGKYDRDRSGWDYKVKNSDAIEYKDWVPQKDLTKA